MNGRKARESGLRLKASIAAGETFGKGLGNDDFEFLAPCRRRRLVGIRIAATSKRVETAENEYACLNRAPRPGTDDSCYFTELARKPDCAQRSGVIYRDCAEERQQ